MERVKRTSLVLAALAGLAAPAAASDFKQFRDWYAACHNLQNCPAWPLVHRAEMKR
jgi:hypothetical protein